MPASELSPTQACRMVPVSEERGGGEDRFHSCWPRVARKRKDALAFFDLTLSNDLENKVVRSWPFMRPSQRTQKMLFSRIDPKHLGNFKKDPKQDQLSPEW